MKTLTAVVALILGASWAFAAAGGRSMTLDINQQDRAFSNSVSRGEAFDWEVCLTRGGTAYTNETITGGGIYYATSRTASAWVVFPFSSWSTSGARVVCRMDATNSMGLSTNAADYPIAYSASIILTTSNNVYRWRQGILTISDDGAVSGSGIAAAGTTMVPNSRTLTINGVTYDLSANRAWTVSTTATLPAGTVAATNQGVAGQSLFWNAGSPTGVSTGYWAAAAGSGDMLASVYDAAGGARQVAFGDDLVSETNRAKVAEAALYPRSNPSNYITLAQAPAQTTQVYVAQAGTAQVAVVAQGMPWSGLTGAAPKLATVTNADTVTTVTSSQIAAAGGITNNSVATLAGVKAPSSIGGWLISSGNSTCITWGAGGGCNITLHDGTTVNGALTAAGGGNVLTNGGATLTAGTDIGLSSTILSNGAAITISYTGTGGGSTGGISAATATGIAYAVTAEWATTGTASKATTVTGTQSNRIEAALTNITAAGIAAAGGNTNDASTLSSGTFLSERFAAGGASGSVARLVSVGPPAVWEWVTLAGDGIDGATATNIAQGVVAVLTNGCASGTDLSGSVISNGLIRAVGTALTSTGTNAVRGVMTEPGTTTTNLTFWTGTAAAYAALTTTNASCLYFTY
jgi:filamentous hemagglutinin